MNSNFIAEMFSNLDWRNALLQSYLSVDCRDRSVKAAKKLSPERLSALSDICDSFRNESKIVIVEVPDMIEAEIIGSWMEVIYAMMYQVKAMRTMYNTFVAELRKNNHDLVDLYIKAPFAIFTFPELVTSADWAQGTMVEVLSKKKHFLIITSDRKKMEIVFGDFISKSLKKMGAQVVNMEG